MIKVNKRVSKGLGVKDESFLTENFTLKISCKSSVPSFMVYGVNIISEVKQVDLRWKEKKTAPRPLRGDKTYIRRNNSTFLKDFGQKSPRSNKVLIVVLTDILQNQARFHGNNI